MCDAYGEAYFSQKIVYKWAKHWFASTNLIRKAVHEVETLTRR